MLVSDNKHPIFAIPFSSEDESINERRNENKTARHDIEIGKEAIVGAMSLVNM